MSFKRNNLLKGYVTNSKNQTTIAQSRGLKFLVALMAHSKNDLVQIESAVTLGALTLGMLVLTLSFYLRHNCHFLFLNFLMLISYESVLA